MISAQTRVPRLWRGKTGVTFPDHALASLQEALAGVAGRAPVGQHIVILIARLDRGQSHLRGAFHAGHFYAGLKPRAGRRRPESL